MSGKDSLGHMLFHVPDASCPIIGTGGEIVAERRELHVPNRILMAVVNDHAGACLDRPASHGAVLGPRDDELVVEADANGVDRPAVADQIEFTLLLDDLALFLVIRSQI